MKYQCIKCNRIWGDWDKNDDKNFYSHGLCKECTKEFLIPKINRNQLNEGYTDCFGKCYNGKCDRIECCYYDVCTNLYNEILYET